MSPRWWPGDAATPPSPSSCGGDSRSSAASGGTSSGIPRVSAGRRSSTGSTRPPPTRRIARPPAAGAAGRGCPTRRGEYLPGTTHRTAHCPGDVMPLADHQARVDHWIAQFEEGYFDPLTNMVRLSEEVGELAREVNHRFGRKTKKPEEPDADLGMEMADILFVLICMANREGIDLDDAFARMMQK